MLMNQLPDVQAVFESRGCFYLRVHSSVIPAKEADMAQNSPERGLELFSYDFYKAAKSGNVYYFKARRVLTPGKFVPKFLDCWLRVEAQIAFLERNLLRNFVAVHASAVSSDKKASDHENGAIKTTGVSKEVEKGVSLPHMKQLAVRHAYFDSQKRLSEIAT